VYNPATAVGCHGLAKLAWNLQQASDASFGCKLHELTAAAACCGSCPHAGVNRMEACMRSMHTSVNIHNAAASADAHSAADVSQRPRGAFPALSP
jgi:hypothetical protein